MAKTRDNYQVVGNTPEELVRSLNFLFQRLADRMDKIEGIRGTATISSDLDMSDNRVRSVGAGSLSTDGARLSDLETDTIEFGNVDLTGDLKVYDDEDHLIHSME